MTTPADANHPHYEWGASSAKQWRGCPGSVNLVIQKKAEGVIPKDTSTRFSDEGTQAHDWADKCLTGKIKRADIPAEFLEHLGGYLDLAGELAMENGGQVFNEQQVKLFYSKKPEDWDTNPIYFVEDIRNGGMIPPGEWKQATGTLDYAVVSNDRVDILDLKYGAGVFVDASENDQLAIYALSLMKQFEEAFEFTDDTIVRCNIYQPRHRDFDGVASWECTYRELKDYGIDIERDYKASKAASIHDLKPSKDACQFCDARRGCTVRVASLFEDIPDEANPISSKFDPSKLEAEGVTDLVRLRVFEKGKEIAKWFADVNEDSLAMIERGVPITGLKSVDGGKGNRSWGNETDAAKLLRELPAEVKFLPRRLISPAQAEAALKKAGLPFEKQSTKFKNRWKQIIKQAEGKPSLALESDKKPARVSAPEKFDDETITEDDVF